LLSNCAEKLVETHGVTVGVVEVVAVEMAAIAGLQMLGLFRASVFTNELLAKFVDVYRDGSFDCAAGMPLKYASVIGKGDVPGAPVKAILLPPTAAIFACRFACASLNSLRSPFSTMLFSFKFRLYVCQFCRKRLPTYRASTAKFFVTSR